MERFTIIWNTTGDVCLDHVSILQGTLPSLRIADYSALLGVHESEQDNLVILAVFDGHITPRYSILE